MSKQSYNIAFFGTPLFATLILDELKHAGITPTLVVTAPDRPRGRGLKVMPPEVKVWAQENNIDVLQPEKVRDEAFLSELRNSEWDVFIVAAYGKILPQELLDIPRRGVLNVHASLLPKFRGASPIQGQILADEKEVGVTIMQIDAEMDHGPTVAQARIELEEMVDADTLLKLLAHEGGKLLSEVAPDWIKGSIEAAPQNHALATYTKKIEKEDGLLTPDNTEREKYLKYLAYKTWPGAFFFVEHNGLKRRIRITDATFEHEHFVIHKVVPEGKSEISYRDFEKSLQG